MMTMTTLIDMSLPQVSLRTLGVLPSVAVMSADAASLALPVVSDGLRQHFEQLWQQPVPQALTLNKTPEPVRASKMSLRVADSEVVVQPESVRKLVVKQEAQMAAVPPVLVACQAWVMPEVLPELPPREERPREVVTLAFTPAVVPEENEPATVWCTAYMLTPQGAVRQLEVPLREVEALVASLEQPQPRPERAMPVPQTEAPERQPVLLLLAPAPVTVSLPEIAPLVAELLPPARPVVLPEMPVEAAQTPQVEARPVQDMASPRPEPFTTVRPVVSEHVDVLSENAPLEPREPVERHVMPVSASIEVAPQPETTTRIASVAVPQPQTVETTPDVVPERVQPQPLAAPEVQASVTPERVQPQTVPTVVPDVQPQATPVTSAPVLVMTTQAVQPQPLAKPEYVPSPTVAQPHVADTQPAVLLETVQQGASAPVPVMTQVVQSPPVPTAMPSVQPQVTDVRPPAMPEAVPVMTQVVQPSPEPTAMPNVQPQVTDVRPPAMPEAVPVMTQTVQPQMAAMPSHVAEAKPAMNPEAVQQQPVVRGESKAAVQERPETVLPSVMVGANVVSREGMLVVDLRSPVAPLLSRQLQETARAALVLQVAQGVAEAIVMQPSVVWGEGEVRVMLSPQVLGGTEIRIGVVHGGITVQLLPTQETMLSELQSVQPQLQAYLAEHLSVYQRIRVEVRGVVEPEDGEQV